MKVVKWLLWTIAIILGALTAFLYVGGKDFLVEKLIQNNNKDFGEAVKSPEKSAYNWGVVIRPFALSTPDKPSIRIETTYKQIDEQFDLIKKLGANSIRVGVEKNNKVSDYIIEKAQENDLKVLFGLDEEINFNNPGEDLYQRGYNFAYSFASRYKGKIQYYQLLNEISGTAVRRNEDEGETLPNRYNLKYDKERYQNLSKYLKGLSDGVKAGDPKAQRLISAHWVLIDIFNYLIADKVNFEIIGWDWYSDMGDDISNRKIDEGGNFNLAEEASKMGKKLWIVEANIEGGSFGDKEKEQADYIKDFALKTYLSGKTEGFFVHTLTDMAADQDKTIGHLGLVKVEKNESGQWEFGQLKSAFLEYQKIIRDNKYLNNN